MHKHEWSIQELARLTGATSRTLRHYDNIGLLTPARVGANGYRYYGEIELRALQRILLLRDLGIGLTEIRRILTAETDEVRALMTHRDILEQERTRIVHQITAVEHALAALHGKEPLMAETMFEGFDHSMYHDEVARRWGKGAAERSADWWNAQTPTEQHDWLEGVSALNRDWIAAWEAGEDPTGDTAQELAQRHITWLTTIPGTPAHDPAGDTSAYVKGLAEMYVADERFAANYGGLSGARFVRDALIASLA